MDFSNQFVQTGDVTIIYLGTEDTFQSTSNVYLITICSFLKIWLFSGINPINYCEMIWHGQQVQLGILCVTTTKPEEGTMFNSRSPG